MRKYVIKYDKYKIIAMNSTNHIPKAEIHVHLEATISTRFVPKIC